MTKPKLNDKPTSHYNDMLLALIPIMLCATVLYGGRVLLICATGFAVARAVDVWVAVMRHKEIDVSDKSSAVAAITFCMLLPVSIPLYVVAMTVALVTLVGKHIFGGKDVYPFSLAALSMCVAAVNWPEEVFKAVKPFSQVAFWSGVSQSTISGAGTIKMGGLPYISNLNLILGNYAGPMGASFVLIIFAVAVFLLSTKRITWHIPVSFLLTCCAFSILFPRIYGISVFTSLKFEMLSGALIFSAIFMLNEPATTPKNPKAKIAFGILVGLVSMLFRYFGSYEIGVCFALLLVNATEGFVD
ncbi:MAG: RnfABCDGE type electron transport complex subunit D, partial [Oscillospiraceae bacterium]